MLSNEVGQQENAIQKQYSDLKETYDKKNKGFEFLKTSKEKLQLYFELDEKIKFANKKKT